MTTWRAITAVGLLILGAAEALTAFKANESVNAAQVYAAVMITPLFVMGIAVWRGSRTAWACSVPVLPILIGALVLHGYYFADHGSDYVMMFGLSIITYWFGAFLSLFSYGARKL